MLECQVHFDRLFGPPAYANCSTIRPISLICFATLTICPFAVLLSIFYSLSWKFPIQVSVAAVLLALAVLSAINPHNHTIRTPAPIHKGADTAVADTSAAGTAAREAGAEAAVEVVGAMPWHIATAFCWMGPSGSVTGLHSDDENNVLLQVRGPGSKGESDACARVHVRVHVCQCETECYV